MLAEQVWVGPHAIIVGGVTIGRDRSRTADGAFVTDSIPLFSRVEEIPP